MGYAIAALIAALIFELITWGIEYEFFYRPFVREFIRSGRFNTPRFERAYYKRIKQIALVAIAGSIDMIVFLSSFLDNKPIFAYSVIAGIYLLLLLIVYILSVINIWAFRSEGFHRFTEFLALLLDVLFPIALIGYASKHFQSISPYIIAFGAVLLLVRFALLLWTSLRKRYGHWTYPKFRKTVDGMVKNYNRQPTDGVKDAIICICASEVSFLIRYLKECDEPSFRLIETLVVPGMPEEKRSEELLDAMDKRKRKSEEA